MSQKAKSKLSAFINNAGDIAGVMMSNVHGILTVMVLSAVIGLFTAYAVAYPGGPGAFIGEVFATVCLSGGACDLGTLNAGAAMAAVLLAGFGLALLRAVRMDDPEAKHDDVLERFDYVVDILDEMQTRLTPIEEMIADPAAFQDNGNAEELARLEALADG